MFRRAVERTGFSPSDGPETNQTIWRSNLHGFIHSSPAIADGGIFLGTGSGTIYCLDEATGGEIWHYLTNNWIASSPAVSNGRVYIGSEDGRLYCFNESTGEPLWSYETGGAVFSSPIYYKGKVLVGSHDGRIYCFVDSGELLWTFSTWAPEAVPVIFPSLHRSSNVTTRRGGSIWSSPAISGGKVYFGCENGHIYCLDEATGELIWNQETQGPIWSSPAISGGRLYIGSKDGHLYALNGTTGGLMWTFKTESSIYSSPAASEGLVVVGSNDGRVYCLSDDDGSLIWSFKTGDWVYSSPAIADGSVFIGSNDGRVYCLDLSMGKVIWSYKTDDRVSSSPAVANGNIYVGSYDGHLYAIGSNQIESTFPYYLTLYSPYGKVNGAGRYRANSTTEFSVSPTTVSGGPGIRYVFTHWTSNRLGGFTGPNATVYIVMDKAISETAHWKTQYYLKLDVINQRGGRVSPTSGWYDAGSTVTIEATSKPGYRFVGFEGSGEGSYTGTESSVPLQFMGPVNETATFRRLYPIHQYAYISLIIGLSVVGYLLYQSIMVEPKTMIIKLSSCQRAWV